MAQLDHIKSSVDGSIIVRICQIPLVLVAIGLAIFFKLPTRKKSEYWESSKPCRILSTARLVMADIKIGTETF